MRRLAAPLCLVLGALACSPSIDLKTSARVQPVASGWFDAGITEDGKNKLVPSISFTLTNTGDRPYGILQVNCIFKRVGEQEEWSTVLVYGRAAGLDRLAPGATSPPVVVRAPMGYTGIEPRADILQNKLFVDAKVEIFGKAGSATPVKLAEVPISRQLLTK
jgi:hypothetical protein